MGFGLTWVAVRGKSETQIRSELGLKGTGKTSAIAESDFADAMLPSGWHLVVSEDCLFYWDKGLLAKLSASCEVLTCAVEEHVMYSGASFWKGGSLVWELEHQSEIAIANLKITGTPPPGFSAIRDRLFEAQRDEKSTYQGMHTDYIFDIPIEVAYEITQYRHDRDILGLDEEMDEPFEILEAIAPPAKPLTFFQRLFGRSN